MKKVYMIEGYSLITGNQGIIDYIEASNESEACRLYEERNFECEVNEVLDVMSVEEYEEMISEV